MSVLNNVKPYESLTLWGTQSLLNLRSPEEGIAQKVGRILLSEAGFAALVATGLLETAIKASVLAAVKFVSFVHPDKERFRQEYVLEATKYFTFSAIGVAHAVTALFANFLPDEIADAKYATVANAVGKFAICCAGEFDDRTISGTPVSWLESSNQS